MTMMPTVLPLRRRTAMAGVAMALAAATALPTGCLGFAPPIPHVPSARTRKLLTHHHLHPVVSSSSSSSALSAKKKKGKSGGSKGFGKAPAEPERAAPAAPATADVPSYDDATGAMESTGGLTSVDGSSTSDFTAPPPIELDPDLSPEERAAQILRKQYGLKTAAETEQDVAKVKREMELAGTIKKRKDKLEKYRQMSDEEFDIFEVIPAPLLKFIDVFLKGGLTIVTTLFVAAGIGITVEAWSKATGNDLPEDLDNFIVQTVEPNFTTGLLVLLGFSISLGVFASAQLGSGSSVYSEDP